jgi:ParB family chromosome partitioning protein
VEPAVVNKDNTIIGGHMRVRAAEAVGFTKVPAYYVDLPEDKARILNLALNRITGRWDVEKLGRLITDLTLKEVDMTLTGFDDWELQYYNQGPSKNTDVDNTNEEISDETLQNGLDIECPRCHFRFKKG